MSSVRDFQTDKQRAIDELYDMNNRANESYKSKNNYKENKNNYSLKAITNGINIPTDALLILGLIMILANEKCDKMLVLALLYILV